MVIFPIARTHYYVLLLPAVAFVSLWHFEQRRAHWAVALAIVPCVLVICHYVFLNVTGRIGLLGLGTTLWCLTAGVAMLWPHRSAVSQARALRSEVSSVETVERRMAA